MLTAKAYNVNTSSVLSKSSSIPIPLGLCINPGTTSRLCLNALQLEHAFGGRGVFAEVILKHYKMAFLTQVSRSSWVLASVGRHDPTGILISTLSGGKKTVYIQGLRQKRTYSSFRMTYRIRKVMKLLFCRKFLQIYPFSLTWVVPFLPSFSPFLARNMCLALVGCCISCCE